MKQEVLPPLIKRKYDTVAFQKFLKVTIVLLLIARFFLLNFTKIPDVLGERFEVTTPITSLKKCNIHYILFFYDSYFIIINMKYLYIICLIS